MTQLTPEEQKQYDLVQECLKPGNMCHYELIADMKIAGHLLQECIKCGNPRGWRARRNAAIRKNNDS